VTASSETLAANPDHEFIYRATFSDGRVEETAPRRFRPDQPRFVGMAQYLLRKRDPGSTVVRLLRTAGGEWHEG
jgi:hypothetical protein